MRTIIQFGDVLLVISIYLGGTFPQHNKTSINAISATDCLMYPTIIRPCLRQFSFKFCDHRSPLPHPSFFSRNRTSLACPPAWIQCKILQLQQAQAHKQNIATSTQTRYYNKHKYTCKILQQAQHVCWKGMQKLAPSDYKAPEISLA